MTLETTPTSRMGGRPRKTKPDIDDGELLTVAEVCNLLKCGRSTFYSLHLPHVEAIKISARSVRYSKAEVLRYIRDMPRQVSK